MLRACQWCDRSVLTFPDSTCCNTCDETHGLRHCKNCQIRPCIEDCKDYYKFQKSRLQEPDATAYNGKWQQEFEKQHVSVVRKEPAFPSALQDSEASLCDFCEWQEKRSKSK